MRPWLTRLRGSTAVVREAQIDYRDGLLEARAERIAELEGENATLRRLLDSERHRSEDELARLRQELHVARHVQHAPDWMARAAQRRVGEMDTVQVPGLFGVTEPLRRLR